MNESLVISRQLSVVSRRLLVLDSSRCAVLALAMVLGAGAHAAADSRLLDAMPNDAVAVLAVDFPQRALPPSLLEPLLNALAPTKQAAQKVLAAVKRMPGGFAIGMVPPSTDDRPPVVIAAMDLSKPGIEFDAWLENQVMPSLEAMAGTPVAGAFRLEEGKDAGRIIRVADNKPVFSVLVKGKIAFASNKPPLVLQWRRGEYPKKRWTGLPGMRRMIKHLGAGPAMRLLFNPKPLHRYLPQKPKPNSDEALLLKVLSPQDVEAAALDLNWTRRGLTVRMAIALAEECKGIAAVLDRPPSEARCLGIFPDDFQMLGRIGWTNASGLFDGLYELTDQFDKTISAEYREELAEFRKEASVYWDTDLLGNLVHEVAFGLRVDFTRRNPIGWAAIFPLRDEQTFSRQLEALIAHYELTFKDEDVESPRVRTAVGTAPISMAVTSGLLILADGPDTIVDIAKRTGRKTQGRPAGKTLARCYEALGEKNQLAFVLDIEKLRHNVPFLPAAVGPALAPLFAEGAVGTAMTLEDRVARVDLRWDLVSSGAARQDLTTPAPGGDEAMATLVNILAKSFVAARQQSKRIVSMANMRAIGQSFHMYASQHKGEFPESLEALLRAMPDSVALEVFTSPHDGTGPTSIDEVETKSYLIYRPGLSQSSVPLEIILAERNVVDGRGANFLFVDGHVEFIAEPRAQELIDLIEAGADEIRR